MATSKFDPKPEPKPAPKPATVKPDPIPEPTEQDAVVNAGQVKFKKLTDLQEDELVRAGFQALNENRAVQASDGQGRDWVFRPTVDESFQMHLAVSVAYRSPVDGGVRRLGANRLPPSQLQSEAGEQLLRSVIAILGGAS